MRLAFFSCVVLCTTQLVGALPSSLFTNSLDDIHLLEHRQYPTVDIYEELPLDGPCSFYDSRLTTSSTPFNAALLIPGTWKAMGNCPADRVQIRDVSYGPQSKNRGCCLDKVLACNTRKTGICRNPGLQNNCPKPGVWGLHDPKDCPIKNGVNTVCCTGPYVNPSDRYGLSIDELLASADDPPPSTENLYPVPQENSYQPPPASNPWGVSTPQAPVLPKAAQNFALLPSNGYNGESQRITSPAVVNPVAGTPNDSNEWSTILNIPGLAT